MIRSQRLECVRSVLMKAVEDLKRPEDANNNDNQMDVSPTMKMSMILVEGLIVARRTIMIWIQ